MSFATGGRSKLVCLWDIAKPESRFGGLGNHRMIKRREFYGHTGFVFGLAIYGPASLPYEGSVLSLPLQRFYMLTV